MLEILAALAQGASQTDLGRSYGVYPSAFWAISVGRSWPEAVVKT